MSTSKKAETSSGLRQEGHRRVPAPCPSEQISSRRAWRSCSLRLGDKKKTRCQRRLALDSQRRADSSSGFQDIIRMSTPTNHRMPHMIQEVFSPKAPNFLSNQSNEAMNRRLAAYGVWFHGRLLGGHRLQLRRRCVPSTAPVYLIGGPHFQRILLFGGVY